MDIKQERKEFPEYKYEQYQKITWWEKYPKVIFLIPIILWVLLLCLFLEQFKAEANCQQYGFQLDDVILMTQLVDGDFRIGGDGEFSINHQKPNYEEIYKVLCVVMNRQRNKQFPNSVKEVILQPEQFHVMPRNSQTIPHWKSFWIVLQWCNSYDIYDKSVQVVPKDHLYFYGDGLRNHTRNNY